MIYMRMIVLTIFCLLATRPVWAQDERFFRKLFSGEFLQEKKVEDEKKYSYMVHTPEYLLDLNDDGPNEAIVSVKRDSEDWIDIFNSYKEKIFSYRFENKGTNSGLYRIVKKHLDKDTVVLVLFYYEGETNYVDYESSARVYLLTVDNKDLKTISIFKGPSIFEEVRTLKGHYHLRNYDVGVADLAHDRTKQLFIKYRDMSRVFIYSGKGNWKTL